MKNNVWSYRSTTQCRNILMQAFRKVRCPCCPTQPLLELSDRSSKSDGRCYSKYDDIHYCVSCGWWFVSKDTWDSSCGCRPDHAFRTVHATGAALKSFKGAISSSKQALLKQEIELHFQGTGKSIAWAALEDTTSIILKEFGYDSRVTARSKDGGVDIILGDEKNEEIYVQVKHSRNKVGVRVLRELVGTMAINSKNRSLLVTSSDFTRGVINEQEAAESKGFVVELVDGNQILSALNLTERLTPPELADIEKVANPSIQLISEEREL